MSPRRIVVVGAGPAGLSAARAALRQDPTAEVTVLEASPRFGHAACSIPRLIDHRIETVEDLEVPRAIAAARDLLLYLDRPVQAIDPHRRRVRLQEGGDLGYDRLILCPGGRAARLGVEGEDQPGVLRLRRPEDALAIRERIEERRPRCVLIAGAGSLGLELADILRGLSLPVTLIERSATPLGGLPAELDRELKRALREAGCELRTSESIARIEPEPDGRLRVWTERGARGFDLVLLAVGVEPRVELARAAGIELGKTGALRVDRRCETSHGGIFAAGDCVQVPGVFHREARYCPLSGAAHRTGRAAGRNAAGGREVLGSFHGSRVISAFGLQIGRTGWLEQEAERNGRFPVAETLRTDCTDHGFLLVHLVADRRDGQLLGAALLGSEGVLERVNLLSAALSGRMTCRDLQDLDLAYLPDAGPVWDPVVTAARMLGRRLPPGS